MNYYIVTLRYSRHSEAYIVEAPHVHDALTRAVQERNAVAPVDDSTYGITPVSAVVKNLNVDGAFLR